MAVAAEHRFRPLGGIASSVVLTVEEIASAAFETGERHYKGFRVQVRENVKGKSYLFFSDQNNFLRTTDRVRADISKQVERYLNG